MSPLAVVVDDFDVVAVGVEHERGVVAVVVAGALTRLTVAAVSGSGRVRVEPAYVVVFARERCFCPIGQPFRGSDRLGPRSSKWHQPRERKAACTQSFGPIRAKGRRSSSIFLGSGRRT